MKREYPLNRRAGLFYRACRLIAIIALSAASTLLTTENAFAPPIPHVEARPIEAKPREPTPAELFRAQELARQKAAEQKAKEDAARTQAQSDWGGVDKDGRYSVWSAVESPEAQAALRSYLESNDVATQIGMTSWKFSERPTVEGLGRALRQASDPLPGKVQVSFFLDDAVMGDALTGMRSAAGERVSDTPDSAFLEAQLSARKGNTWIIVGHVEGKQYVMYDARGNARRISIPDLMTASVKHGVLVIPLGCQTAAANVPLGFVKRIGTDNLERFLTELPLTKPLVADLLVGLQRIGDLQIGLKDFLDQLDIRVVDPNDGMQYTRIKIPYGNPYSASNNISWINDAGTKLATLIADEEEEAKPWWAKKWMKAVVNSPLTYVGLWLIFWVITWLWRQKLLSQSRMTFEQADLAILLNVPTIITQWGASIAGIILGLVLLAIFPPLIFLLVGAGLVMNFVEWMDKQG